MSSRSASYPCFVDSLNEERNHNSSFLKGLFVKNYGRFYLELRGWRWLGLNLEKNLEILEIWEFFSQYLQYLAKEGLVAPITFFSQYKTYILHPLLL